MGSSHELRSVEETSEGGEHSMSCSAADDDSGGYKRKFLFTYFCNAVLCGLTVCVDLENLISDQGTSYENCLCDLVLEGRCANQMLEG